MWPTIAPFLSELLEAFLGLKFGRTEKQSTIFELYGQLKLMPDNTIVFKNKSKLTHQKNILYSNSRAIVMIIFVRKSGVQLWSFSLKKKSIWKRILITVKIEGRKMSCHINICEYHLNFFVQWCNCVFHYRMKNHASLGRCFITRTTN